MIIIIQDTFNHDHLLSLGFPFTVVYLHELLVYELGRAAPRAET